MRLGGPSGLAVVIRRFEAAQLLLARRAEECNAYAARAHSGADWLATLNGTSKAEAARALDTAKRLDDCPATKAAFAAGEISTDEADAVSGAAKADPTCEQRLLDGAKARHDLRETRTRRRQGPPGGPLRRGRSGPPAPGCTRPAVCASVRAPTVTSRSAAGSPPPRSPG